MKSLYFLLLYHFDSLVQVSQTHGLVYSHYTSNRKFCLMVCQQMGYPQPIQGADNSSISFSLIMLIIELMVGVPKVTGTQDPKLVESGMTRAT